MKKRRDTRLEAEGAEFLVVGWLLVNGIEAHKTYSIKGVRVEWHLLKRNHLN